MGLSYRETFEYVFEVEGQRYTGEDSRIGQGVKLVPKVTPEYPKGEPIGVVYDPARPEYNRAADDVENSPEWRPNRWVLWLLMSPISAVLVFLVFLIAAALWPRLSGQNTSG